MSSPRVSVVLPTWNRKGLLGEALESVLAQTYRDYEIVIVDDGSTDGTEAWLRERYAAAPIVYRWQENRGVAAARNEGMRIARGELIAFLDSDDLWMPEKLARQVPLFDRPEVGFVFCGNAQLDERGRVILARRPGPEFRGRAALAMIRHNMMPTPTVVLRRALALETGPMYEDLVFGEDWNYWVRIAARCEVDYVPDILVQYRDTPGSLSRLAFEGFRENTIALFDGIFRDPEAARLLAPYRAEARSEARRRVAEEALARERFDIAREEAWASIRFRPGNREAWRLYLRALAGKRVLDALRRLR